MPKGGKEERVKAIYKMNFDYGRSGSLEGVFVAEKEHVKILVDKKIEIYFGEVLGKHSEVVGIVTESEIKMISDNPEVVEIFEKHDLSSGYNPFGYSAVSSEGSKRGIEGDDITVYEIAEWEVAEAAK
jgi:hypothetical protein